MTPEWEIYNEDCLSGIARLVPAGSVDVIVTSPPGNNIGKQYGHYNDSREESDYLDWMKSVSKGYFPRAVESGFVFLKSWR